MKKITSYILFTPFLLLSVTLYSAEPEKEINFKKIADDMKFENGVSFYTLKKYDRALNEFHEYLEIYNNGIHRDEAFNRIAEIHFNRFNYLKSAEIYIKLYEEYSNSERGIKAFYKAGLIYMKMGYKGKAVNLFNKIINSHGDSSIAQEAQLQLDLIEIVNETK